MFVKEIPNCILRVKRASAAALDGVIRVTVHPDEIEAGSWMICAEFADTDEIHMYIHVNYLKTHTEMRIKSWVSHMVKARTRMLIQKGIRGG